MRSLLLVLLLSATATADTYKVYASYGIEVDSDKPCGPATRAELAKFVTHGLELAITADAFSYFRRDELYDYPSHKRYVQEDGTTIGIWYQGRRSIVIQSTPQRNGEVSVTVTFLVEKDAKKRDAVSCFEQWVGARGVRK